jgi:hypothetical protein
MKTTNAGFCPAYNVQVASAVGEQIIVAVATQWLSSRLRPNG